MSIKALAVFCGSQNGKNTLYAQQAKTLGRLLAENGVALIYGGGKNGLMGSVADGAMAAGGAVHGIIPQLLTRFENQHTEITELVIVEDMHVRKRSLYERCDAALILPGGFGTLDELFEILTWNQLSIHNKKVFLLNTAGFYDHLLAHLHKMEEEGMLYTKVSEQVLVMETPEEMMQYI